MILWEYPETLMLDQIRHSVVLPVLHPIQQFHKKAGIVGHPRNLLSILFRNNPHIII